MTPEGPEGRTSTVRSPLLRALLRGVKSPEREARTVFVLGEYYVDDSDAGRFRSLGGVMSTAGAWDDFSDEWEPILAKAPRVPHWNMANARARNYPFDVFSDWRHVMERELELAEVIRKHALRGYSVAVNLDDWARYAKGKLNPAWHIRRNPGFDPEWWIRTYESERMFLLKQMSSMIQVALKHSNHLFDKVHVFFEKSGRPEEDHTTEYEAAALEGLRIYNNGEEIIKSISFMVGKQPDSRPLEAADMFSWCARRYVIEGRKREPIWDVIEQITGKIITLGRDSIERYVDALNNPQS